MEVRVQRFFEGDIGNFFFCSKVGSEYRLFKTNIAFGGRISANGIKGWIVNQNYGLSNESTFNKGQYYELRLGNFNKVPTFAPKTKVLALKPKGNNIYDYKFSFAKVVSGPRSCPRGSKGLSSGNNERYKTRNVYTLQFDDNKESVEVFDDYIAPTEEYWGNEQDSYGPKEDNEQKEEEDLDSETSEEKAEKHKNKRKQHKHHKEHHRKHHKHQEAENPQIIIMPIIIPISPFYPQVPQQQFGYM